MKLLFDQFAVCRVTGARITLDNFTSNIFQPTGLNATWLGESSLAFLKPAGDLVVLDTNTLTETVLVTRDVFVSFFYLLSLKTSDFVRFQV